MEHIIYTQEQFISDIEEIIKQLSAIDFQPDLIVGIIRGGVVPAIHLSHKLNCSIKLIEWSGRDSKIKDWRNLDKVAIMAEHGKKVLLIDDIVDSGITLCEIKQRLFDTKKNILYGTLWYNPGQTTSVDFYCNTIDRATDDRWVYMPWELPPNYSELL
jgi:hypoxanthine phosphoribosyltransferase